MVARGLTSLTRQGSVREAWRSLVNTNDVVGLKVFSAPGATSGTRLPVVAAVIEGLLESGLPPANVVIWDRSLTDLRLAGYVELAERYGVRVAGAAQAGYDERVFYESPLLGNLVYGDHEFGRPGEGVGRKSFVSRLVTRELTRIINLPPLLNQNLCGTAGNLYSLTMGSVDNTLRFESAERMAIAVPEIYALEAVGDKVTLNIVDALICQYEGEQRVLLHYARAFNELRFSFDPVALDVMSVKDIDRERGETGSERQRTRLELYSNAAELQLGVSDPRRIRVERVE
jgi:hypothetical protein